MTLRRFDNHDAQVTRLKKQKQDLENRLREQEEELDDLAGQVYSHGDGGDGDGGEGGDGVDEDLDNHFVQFLSLNDGPKLTCNLEVTKTTLSRCNSWRPAR